MYFPPVVAGNRRHVFNKLGAKRAFEARYRAGNLILEAAVWRLNRSVFLENLGASRVNRNNAWPQVFDHRGEVPLRVYFVTPKRTIV
jgi:hypothetical protein